MGLQLQRVVRSQLDMLVLRQVLAAQPDLLACNISCEYHSVRPALRSVHQSENADCWIRGFYLAHGPWNGSRMEEGHSTFRVKIDALDADAQLELDLLALLPSTTLALNLSECCGRDNVAFPHQIIYMPQVLPCINMFALDWAQHCATQHPD